MDAREQLAFAAGFGMLAGLNLYATVATIGLLVRFQLLSVPAGFEVFDNPWVIGVALTLYACEFVADKVPWFDTVVWDTIHTFIRPFGAAAGTFAAMWDADPSIGIIAGLLAGSVATASHSTKALVRANANLSPEPVSNTVLSLAEDAVAIGGTLLIARHPYIFGGLAVLFLLVFLWFTPMFFRLFHAQLRTLRGLFGVSAGGIGDSPTGVIPDPLLGESTRVLPAGPLFAHRGVVHRISNLPTRSSAFLAGDRETVAVLARVRFQPRSIMIPVSALKRVVYRRGFLADRLILITQDGQFCLRMLRNERTALQRTLAFWIELGVPVGEPAVAAPGSPLKNSQRP